MSKGNLFEQEDVFGHQQKADYPGAFFNQTPEFRPDELAKFEGDMPLTEMSDPGAVFAQGEKKKGYYLILPNDEEIDNLVDNIGPTESAKKAVSERIIASRRSRLGATLVNIDDGAVMSA